MTTSTQWLFKKNGFAPKQVNAPEAVFRVSQEGQPRRPATTGIWPVMGGRDAPDCLFIDFGVKRLIDLLSDPWAAEPWVTSFEFDDGLDEFGCRALWTRLAVTASRIQPSVLSLPEQAVEFQQRRRPDDHGSPLDMRWAEKK